MADGIVPQYRYVPLSARCIRVLRIVSPPKQTNIEIELDVIQLDDRGERSYDCLSYTWGDPWDPKLPILRLLPVTKEPSPRMTGKGTEKIYCQGQYIKVSENCLHALQRLAGDCRQTWIWIDAICIDQNTESEKEQQIPLMGKIYKNADSVIVWLGKEDRATRDAQRLLQNLSHVDPSSEILEARAYEIDTTQAYEQLMEASEDLGLTDIGIDEWLHLAHFLQRTWFSRVWVVQEVFFSRGVPKVLIGEQDLDWNEMMKGMGILAKTRLDTVLKAYVLDMGVVEEPYSIAKAAAEVVENRLANALIFGNMHAQKKKRRFRMDQLLYYTRFFNATEPKDHIYGLQGLWKPSAVGNELPKGTLPPYESPFETTFIEAMRIAISETGRLDVLGLCGNVCEDLPSWVVDFRQKPQLYPLTRNLEFEEYPRRWQAGRDMKPAPMARKDCSDARKLWIDGFEFDEVIGEQAPSFQEVDSGFQISRLLRIFARAQQDIYGASGIYLSFLRTILKDTYIAEPTDAKISDGFSAFLAMRILEHELQIKGVQNTAPEKVTHKLISLLEDTRGFVDELSSENPKFPSWAAIEAIKNVLGQDEAPGKKELDQQVMEFSESFRIAYFGRRLFQTRKGYFGITSESVEQGDRVWISPSSDTPLVLRPKTGKGEYVLVGEAYIQGIMHGEAAEAEPCGYACII